jgi:hypothetical protein
MRLASSVPIAIAIALAAAPTLAAQTTLSPPASKALPVDSLSRSVRIDLPILDAPFNVAHGLRAPSMAQSLAITESFYELAHPAIERAWGDHHVLSGISLVLFDTFGSLLPGGDGWVHEEYHRAVLANRGVGSFDDIYYMNLVADVVNVSHVKDADLIRFKAEHPADIVRAAAAGIEGENMLIRGLEKNRFFQGSRANNVPLYWLSKINSLWYVASGVSSDADSLTDSANMTDGADVPKRDWVGHDFTAWVHDLHRPTEPYEARGVHPSGVGIDRYIKASDLTTEEHDFLAREGLLQAINFLDPNLFAFSGITVRNPWSGADLRVNASASHYLTSFGHTIDVNLFMKQDATNLFVVMHRYTNGARSFLGVEGQLLDAPITIGGVALDVSPRVALWLQPDAQAFRSTSAQPGALVSLRVRPVSNSRIATFVELEGKTAGWVAGNVHLDRNVSIRLGGSVKLN